MITRIYTELLKRAKQNRAKGQFDLDMKNGDEITIYLEGQDITWGYKAKDYSILTDDNKVIHFNTLADIAEWIEKAYC